MNRNEPQAPAAVFEAREAAFAAQEKIYKNRSWQVAMLRLAVFLAGVSAVFWLFYNKHDAAGFAAAALIYWLFLLIMRWHNRLNYRQKHYLLLQLINREEQERLSGSLSSFDSGERYRNDLHPYTSDLDVFGKHSLFQLLNRAVTAVGKDKLAAWLQQAAQPAEVLARQEAVLELAPETDWRQELEAKARHYKHQQEQSPAFFAFLQEPDFFRNKPLLRFLIFALPPLTVVLWLLSFYGVVSYYSAAGFSLLQYLISAKYRGAKETYHTQAEQMHEQLRSYADLLQHTEKQPFKSAKLQQLQQRLKDGAQPASGAVRQLARLVDFLNVTHNAYMNFLLNNLLMWDFFWMLRLERWKQQMEGNLEAYLDVVAEVEALSSMAGFRFAYPQYAVPELSEEPFEVNAQQLGHPLIFASERITNNFELSGAGKSCVITGSNMSGKSTFLRTLGLNMVLALAGAPVCAQRLRLYPVQVFTSMRTSDNLAESTSSFYAELKRLRQLLDLTETGTPVFYFLDEILKGTNSRDRHLGAAALIRQLHRRTASGLVSTHDLELGQLQQQHPDYIVNYSFNSRIEGNQIIFDYKLEHGICRSFNASKLMQLMGIEIEEEAV